MHDARHVAAMFGAHHQHESSVALGDDLVLQVLGGRPARELFERAAQLLPLLAQLVANALQFGAGLVEHLAARIDRVAHRVHFGLERGDVGHQLAKDGEVGPGTADAGARLIDGINEVGKQAQLERLERPARDVERVEGGGQRVARAKGKQRMPLEEPDRLARGRLQRDHDLRIGRRLEIGERSRAERRQRERGDGVDDAIEFERARGEHDSILVRSGGR